MRVKAILDRIDGDKAILDIHGFDARIVYPAGLVPRGAKEGDVLVLELKKTRKTRRETSDRQKKAKTLLDKLLDKSSKSFKLF